MPETLDELPRVIAVPSDRLWLDPLFINRQLFRQRADVAVGAGAAVQVAKANTARWAIGFAVVTTVGPPFNIGPWPDAGSTNGVQLSTSGFLWYEIGKYGPLVADPWYAFNSSGGTLRVVEIIRNQ